MTSAVALPPPRAAGNSAVIVTGPPVDTPLTLNEAVLAPAGIVTFDGTEAIAGLEELSANLTSIFSTGSIVAVILQLVPGKSDCEQVASVSFGAITLTPDVALPPPRLDGSVAVMVTGPPTETPVTGNETEFLFAGTVTVDGTVAIELLELVSVIVVGLLRVWFSVTVKSALVPATMFCRSGVRVIGGEE